MNDTITIQILDIEGNNKKIIETINTATPLHPEKIVIGTPFPEKIDYRQQKLELIRINKNDNPVQIRKKLAKLGGNLNLYLQAGEKIVKIWEYPKINKEQSYVHIINNGIINKEPRLWTGTKIHFVSNYLDIIQTSSDEVTNIFIKSNKHTLDENKFLLIQKWKRENVTQKLPYYYEAIHYLSHNRVENFINSAMYYLFLNEQENIQSIMMRYYLSVVFAFHQRKIRDAIKNLTICLAYNPMMAEFWCLLGDIFLKHYNHPVKAKHFYENAIILGKERKYKDLWPMHVEKYKSYPKKRIKTCEKIIQSIL